MPRLEWSFMMPAEDHKQVKWFMAYGKSHLTAWGQVLYVILLFGLAVSSVGTQISAYFLPSFILALLITSYFLSLFFRPKIKAIRLLPPSPSAGGYCIYNVLVKNLGKRPARNLSLFEQCLPHGLYPHMKHPQYKNSIDWLAPGESSTLTLVMRTPRRGSFELPPLVAGSSFPSGIVRVTKRTGKREKFTVYPKLIQTSDIEFHLHRQFQPGGISLSSKVGDSNEFSSTREYRQGDRLRDIHWASSARTNKLIVKEYVEEYFVRIGLFLDTELKGFEKHKCFETRISLCAGIADKLNTSDYIIDLFLSDEHHQHLKIGRGVEPFDHLLEILSVIEGDLNVEFSASAARIKEYSSQLSHLIFFLKDWDPKRATFVKQCQDLGLKTQIIIVRDKPLTENPPEENVSIIKTKELVPPK